MDSHTAHMLLLHLLLLNETTVGTCMYILYLEQSENFPLIIKIHALLLLETEPQCEIILFQKSVFSCFKLHVCQTRVFAKCIVLKQHSIRGNMCTWIGATEISGFSSFASGEGGGDSSQTAVSELQVTDTTKVFLTELMLLEYSKEEWSYQGSVKWHVR